MKFLDKKAAPRDGEAGVTPVTAHRCLQAVSVERVRVVGGGLDVTDNVLHSDSLLAGVERTRSRLLPYHHSNSKGYPL